jgi:hypothetical protein
LREEIKSKNLANTWQQIVDCNVPEKVMIGFSFFWLFLSPLARFGHCYKIRTGPIS